MDYKELSKQLNQIPIQKVAALVGVTLPFKGSAHCPFHNDQNKSFEIRPSGIRWICYTCDIKGGAIDFIVHASGWDFIKSKKWLAEKTGLKSTGFTQAIKLKLNIQDIKESDEGIEADPDYELYQYFLTLCPLKEYAYNYLQERGISEKTINKHKIGQVGSSQPLIRNLINKFGFQRIYDAGLFTKKSTPTNIRLIFPEKGILFPYFENEQVVYLQVRVPYEERKEYKWRNLSFRKRRVYNADILLNKNIRSIGICEGNMDVLSGTELGIQTIGFMGVSAPFPPEQIKKLRNKEVDILLDWDAPGEKRVKKLSAELKKYGVVAKRKKRPSLNVKDLNEFLKEKRGLN